MNHKLWLITYESLLTNHKLWCPKIQLGIAIPWLEFNEKFDRSILAPFFDMLNHSERENCSYAYDLGYTFYIHSQISFYNRDVRAGSNQYRHCMLLIDLEKQYHRTDHLRIDGPDIPAV